MEQRDVVCYYCREKFQSTTNEHQPVRCVKCNKEFYYINNVSIDIDEFESLDFTPKQKIPNYTFKYFITTSVTSIIFGILTIIIVMILLSHNKTQDSFPLEQINEQFISLQQKQINMENKLHEEIIATKVQLKDDFEHAINKLSVNQIYTDVLKETYLSIDNKFKTIELKLKEDCNNFITDIQDCMFTDFIQQSDPNTDYLFVDPEIIIKAREKLNKATQIPPVVLAPISNKVLTEKDLIGQWEIFSDGYMFPLTLNEDHTFSYADKNTPWITDGWEIKKDVLLIYWKHNKIKDYSMSEAVDLRTGIYATPNKSRQLQFNDKGEVTKDRQWRRISVMSKIK